MSCKYFASGEYVCTYNENNLNNNNIKNSKDTKIKIEHFDNTIDKEIIRLARIKNIKENY